VVESLAKLVATGFDYKDSYLTFQEYFERLGSDKARWGKPVAALMGALQAQLDFGVAAIGGKDSMSGSFEQLDVPPTLVSFATAIGNTDYVVSPELKQAGTAVALLQPKMLDRLRPDPDSLKELFTRVHKLICDGKVLSAATCGCGSIAETLFKMCLGNRLGVTVNLTAQQLFAPAYGSFVLELAPGVALDQQIGTVSASYTFTAAGEALDLAQLQEQWEQTLEPVLPYRIDRSEKPLQTITDTGSFTRATPKIKVAKPHVLIPVFPGTNCEYDTARALRRAGAEPEILVINNLSPAAVVESCAALVRAIEQSQMIVLPGGFSGGDEPDGSAKFITAFFRAPAVADAVHRLLGQRDGLMLGICNGFQALIKLGLVPFGEIRATDASCPTLTFNTIGRHQSMLVTTRVSSNRSPWLSRCQTGDQHLIAISHGEGRFVANDSTLQTLLANGQLATQYVAPDGQATSNSRYNPNGSILAVEGISSPDGRVLGKMGHTERSGDNLYKNLPGDNKYQPLFEGGVDYFQ
ncbi:MAG: phosphoribosylformylglycinamidine synthase subunit PurQ, partial [Angelakisella sp.]